MAHHAPIGEPSLDQDSSDALIQRIAGSRSFQRSPRQRELLLFIAAEHLAGRAGEISEPYIGHRVFGRPLGYNHSEDNIVRVAVRQLRVRLNHFFEEQGRDEPWLVEIPKGAYRLEFSLRERTPVEILPAARLWLAFRDRLPRRAQVLGLVALGGVCLCLGYALGGDQARRPTASIASATALEELLADGRPVNVVVADSALVMLQALAGRIPSVEDYAGHTFLEPASTASAADASIHRLIDEMTLTSLADVSFVARMLQSADPVRQRIRVRHARNLDASYLRSDDTVILGGPRVNPWAGLFESRLNFRFRYRDVGPGCFLNESPVAGEEAQYGDCGLSDAGDYARIAWVPNLSHSGRVLLISGNSMLATESASDFLLESGSAGRLLAAIGASDFSSLESFELLLHVPHRAGAPTGSKLLAWRVRRS